MSDRELKLKGNQNFDEIREIYDSLKDYEKRISELENVLKTLSMDNKAYKIAQEHNWLVYKDKLNELEKNCEVSFAKVEDHIIRILKVIDIQSQSTEMLTDQIAELRNQIQNNSVADLNHYNELKEGLSSHTNMIGVQMDKYIELKEVLREFFKKMLHYSQIADFPSDQAHTNLRDFYKLQLAKLDGTEEEKG